MASVAGEGQEGERLPFSVHSPITPPALSSLLDSPGVKVVPWETRAAYSRQRSPGHAHESKRDQPLAIRNFLSAPVFTDVAVGGEVRS